MLFPGTCRALSAASLLGGVSGDPGAALVLAVQRAPCLPGQVSQRDGAPPPCGSLPLVLALPPGPLEPALKCSSLPAVLGGQSAARRAPWQWQGCCLHVSGRLAGELGQACHPSLSQERCGT